MTAICITTTPNRFHVLDYCLKKHMEFRPANCKLIVVVDCGNWKFNKVDIHLCEGDILYFLTTHNGIAYSKNKCLELSQDADHVILLDDDVFPIHKDWVQQYLNAHTAYPDQHVLMYMTEQHKLMKDYGTITRYQRLSGVLFSLTRHAINTVGGFNTEGYKPYAWHDISYHNRCTNLKLAPKGMCSINNAHDYLHSLDLDGLPEDFTEPFASSISAEQKEADWRAGAKQWDYDLSNGYYFEYK